MHDFFIVDSETRQMVRVGAVRLNASVNQAGLGLNVK